MWICIASRSHPTDQQPLALARISMIQGEIKLGDYKGLQPDINAKMRSILVDWLVEVHNKFELMPGDPLPYLQHCRPVPLNEGRPEERASIGWHQLNASSKQV